VANRTYDDKAYRMLAVIDEFSRGYIESFNGNLRGELLNREIIYTLKETHILIEQWWRHCNGVRPHSALGYRPPAPETIAFPRAGLQSTWNSMESAAGNSR
jgi:putative transposase